MTLNELLVVLELLRSDLSFISYQANDGVLDLVDLDLLWLVWV